MPGSLLKTKLYAPQARSGLVARPRLGERLEEGMGRKLTLVSAPAGFGKTTLLSEWLAIHPSSERSFAWLSLEEADNDPVRFWRYFIAAIQRVMSDVGETSLAMLGSPQPPSLESVLTALINDVATFPGSFILVLDDYHAITAAPVHEALGFLLDHLPSSFHLIIGTRADPPLPLSRLRAHGEMVELRAADLRFAPDEIAEFFGRSMSVELSAEEVALLEARTEGWAVGLQLTALLMRGREDRGAFIGCFTGSNRYVLDYLAEEVLTRQPGHVCAFLLRTSVLERMCAPLCDAVAGHDGGERADGVLDAQTMLEGLDRDNLFVVPLDDDRAWYRYHHLFADVLRQQLRQAQPDLVPQLHSRASAWFERHGSHGEAVDHALKARDHELAARLIESGGMTVLLGEQVRTVLGWIEALPDALVRSRPALCTLHALGLVFFNRPDAAEVRLQDAERCVEEDPTTDQARTILGRVAVIRAAVARFSGDLERCVAAARRALDLLPEVETTSRERAAARINVALAYQVSGDATPANERLLEAAVASFRASGDLIPFLRGITFLAMLRTLQGRLRAAAATYEEATTMAPVQDRLRDLTNSAAYYVGLGDIQREWNDLDSAESHLKRGVDLFTGALTVLTVEAEEVTRCYLSLARLQQARGRYSDAFATLDEFADLAERRNFFPLLVPRGEAARARIALVQGDLAAAVFWAESSGFGVEDEPSYLHEEQHLTLSRVLIVQGRNDPAKPYLDDALRLLDRLLRAAEGGTRMGSVLEILVLRALALHALREIGAAFAALERALTLAEPEGYVRVFVDEGPPMAALLSQLLGVLRKERTGLRRRAWIGYVCRLLAAFESVRAGVGAHVPAGLGSGPPIVDLLTSREQEVLRLIVAGLSNRAIAARLFVEASTVKSHVNRIFRKLGVESRTQAAAMARETGLVPK